MVISPEPTGRPGRQQKSHPLRVAADGPRRRPRRGANRQARSPPFSRRVWNVIDHERAFGLVLLGGRLTVAGLRRTCTGLPHDISAAPRQRGPVIMQCETGRCAARATSRPAPAQAEAQSGSRRGRGFPPLDGGTGAIADVGSRQATRRRSLPECGRIPHAGSLHPGLASTTCGSFPHSGNPSAAFWISHKPGPHPRTEL